MNTPFSTKFNVAVLRMAELTSPSGYDVAHDGSAPASLAALQDHVHAHRRILVDGRNSDNTIFGCPETNWAFRAWHDWTHYTIRAEFTLDGELAVAHRQCEDLARVFGHDCVDLRLFHALIMSEVYSQALFFAKMGSFPVNQRGFTKRWLAHAPMID